MDWKTYLNFTTLNNMSNVIYSKLIIRPQYIPEWYNSYTMGVTSAAGTANPSESEFIPGF